MVTRDEIRLAYRLLLDREPEGEEAYEAHSTHVDLRALRHTIITSEEGVCRLRDALRQTETQSVFHFFRPVLIFIHIEKTAGSTLNSLLVEHYGSTRSSPAHLNWMPSCSLAELNGYDFVGGHFSFQEAMSLPRAPKTIVTVLRDPGSRLLSFYRFHRSHPDRARHDPMVRLAKDLGPEAFFKHDAVRSSPRIDNAYLRTFSELSETRTDWDRERIEDAVETARRRITEIACVGLAEDMSTTVRLMAAAAGINIPAPVRRINDTGMLHVDRPGFLPDAGLDPSPATCAAIEPLIKYDRRIYAAAHDVFHYRAAQL